MPDPREHQGPYVLALDIGTSSIRALVYDSRGRPVSPLSAARKHGPAVGPDGRSELDADTLLERLFGCVDAVVGGAASAGLTLSAVGCCSFWHSILGVDAAGRPVTPIVMWSDTRSAAEAEELRRSLDERAVHARTGCVLHPSYVPAKLLWYRRHAPEVFEAAARWISIGEYLHLRLFGRAACSHSMASGTGLLDLSRLQWDPEVLAACGLDEGRLSPLGPFSAPLSGLGAPFASRWPALAEVPWYPAVGDGATSNLGSGCDSDDRLALMVGTSGALRLVSPQGDPTPPWGLWCYRIDERRRLYGGALSNGGNLVVWLRRTLQLEPGALEAELAALPPDGHGLTVLPFLAGERNPGWHGSARATLHGLSLHTQPIHILQACLEAVAFRFAAIHDRLGPLAGSVREVVATGGALLRSPAWMRLLADVLQRPIVPSLEEEASSRGAALLTLEATGALKSLKDAPARVGEAVAPNPHRREVYQAARQRHEALYNQLIGA